MIAERFPEVMALSDEDKFRFIAELWEDVAGGETADDPAITALLEQRLAEYRANPQDVSPWEDVKARILASRRG
jgi:putative addiction module component (TIGR02574 family)